MRILLCLLAMVIFSAQAGKIFKIVHDDGSVTYTDSPQPGATEVNIEQYNLNLIQPIARVPQRSDSASPQQRAASAQASAKSANYTLSVLEPQPEATVRNNLGAVTISAEVTPTTDGQYQLIFNGEAVAQSSVGVFQLEGVDRGAHQFRLNFISNSGKILASSQEQTFYMHKASALIKPQQAQ